jgi:hypothetical protein
VSTRAEVIAAAQAAVTAAQASLTAAEGLPSDIPPTPTPTPTPEPPTPTPTPEPPTPTPTPPSATPWPLPPKLGEIWVPRPIDGAPSFPEDPSNSVSPGQDLSKLSKASKLAPGEYFVTGDVKVDLVGTRGANGRPTLCTIKLKSGQNFTCQNISGITVDGGSVEGDDMEKNGSTFLASGKMAHSCRFTGSAGLGLLAVPGGRGTSVWFCEIDDCASGHMGLSKCVDAVVRGNYFHDCNKVGRRNTNKPTRCEGTIIADNIYDRGRSVHLWQDQYNNRTKRATIARNYFGTATPDNKDQPWSIAGLRTEINGPAGVDILDNYFVTFYSCDETRNAVVKGNVFEGRTYDKAIELRNKRRGTPEMWLENVQISGNKFLENKAEIGPSNDSPPSLSKNRIVVTQDNQWPDGKVMSHVTVKP